MMDYYNIDYLRSAEYWFNFWQRREESNRPTPIFLFWSWCRLFQAAEIGEI